MRSGSTALAEEAEKSVCFGKKSIAVTPQKVGGFWIPFKSAHLIPLPPTFLWKPMWRRAQKAQGMFLCSTLRPQRCFSPVWEPITAKLKAACFHESRDTFPTTCSFPLKSRICLGSKGIRNLDTLGSPASGFKLNKGHHACGRSPCMAWEAEWRDAITAVLWRTANCRLPVNSDYQMIGLETSFAMWQQILLSKGLILNPTRSEDYQCHRSFRVIEWITFVLDWDRVEAECFGARTPFDRWACYGCMLFYQ